MSIPKRDDETLSDAYNRGVRDTLARLTTDDAVTAWTRAVMSRGAGPGEDPMEVTRDRLGRVAAALAPRITNEED